MVTIAVVISLLVSLSAVLYYFGVAQCSRVSAHRMFPIIFQVMMMLPIYTVKLLLQQMLEV